MYMETQKPLDEALNFNKENIFDYLDTLLHNMNAETIGDQASGNVKRLFEYIRSLKLENTDEIIFDVEDIVNQALCDNSQYAFRAGFKEACRLIRTLETI
jgi:hypothetical protein